MSNYCCFRQREAVRRDLARYPRTALHLAVLDRDVDKTFAIIDEKGPHLNHCDLYHGCPIHIAVKFRSASCLDWLIRGGADIEVPHPVRNEYTAIEIAAEEGYTYGVTRLWDAGANGLREGQSVLELAALHGHSDLVQELLTIGSVWPMKILEATLHLAAGRREALIVHRLVRYASYSQEVLDEALDLALDQLMTIDDHHYSFGEELDDTRQVETLQFLLDAGADPNYAGGDAPPIRMVASGGCPVRGTELLLKYGAHPDATHGDDMTAIHALIHDINYSCSSSDNAHNSHVQLSRGGIEVLLAYGASLRLLDGKGDSPFHAATRFGDVPVLQRLLHSDPEVRDKLGDTFMAVARERQAMRQEKRDLFAPRIVDGYTLSNMQDDKVRKGALPCTAAAAASSLFTPAATTPLRPLPRVMPSLRTLGRLRNFHTLVPRIIRLGLLRR